MTMKQKKVFTYYMNNSFQERRAIYENRFNRLWKNGADDREDCRRSWPFYRCTDENGSMGHGGSATSRSLYGIYTSRMCNGKCEKSSSDSEGYHHRYDRMARRD